MESNKNLIENIYVKSQLSSTNNEKFSRVWKINIFIQDVENSPPSPFFLILKISKEILFWLKDNCVELFSC